MAKSKKPKLSKSSAGRGLRHKEQITTTLTLEQVAAFNALAARTRLAKSVLFREAIDDLLAKYGRGAKS